MALKTTNLTIQMAPIPATFRGNPNDLAIQMLQRMKIMSPDGSSFIFNGDTKPTSNVGPWLKGGTQWYVWDTTVNDYVPLDISPSFTIPYWMSKSQPTGVNPPLWLQTSKDATDLDPTHGIALYWNLWDGVAWIPFMAAQGIGSTAERPTDPIDGYKFYDLSLNVEIWWERSMWRTTSGVPGDVKAVAFSTLQDALDHNPGWAVFGDTFPAAYGRIISQATQDPGATPVSSVTPIGVPTRAAFETFGTDQGYVDDPADTNVLPGQIALWHLYKL
jgi:hypothetical protein